MVLGKKRSYIQYFLFLIFLITLTSYYIYTIIGDLEDAQYSAIEKDTFIFSEIMKDSYNPENMNYDAFTDLFNRVDYKEYATVAVMNQSGNIIALNNPKKDTEQLEQLFTEIEKEFGMTDFYTTKTDSVWGKKPQIIAIRRVEGLPFYIVISEPPFREDTLAFPIIFSIIGIIIMIALATSVLRAQLRQKKMHTELKQTNQELSTIFDNNKVGIMHVDENRNIKRANNRYAALLGFQSADDLQNSSLSEIHISDENSKNFGELYNTILNKTGYIQVEYEFKHANGDRVWLGLTGTPLDHSIPADASLGTIWTAIDITESKLASLELKQTHSELDAYFTNSLVGIAILRGGRKIHRVNQRLADLMQYEDPDTLKGMSVEDFHISKENYESFGEKFYKALINREIIQVEYPLKRRDGSTIWMSISGKALDSETPPDLDKGVIWIFEDITERRKYEKKLIELATTDTLTGLANRGHFMEAGERELAIHKRHNRPLSILMIDFDYFKAINDTFGHSAGDKALKLFAKVCTDLLRTEDIIGRMGGEEFAVLLPDTKLDKAFGVADRIRKTIEETSSATESETPVFTISVGVTNAGESTTLDAILHNTDEALYSAKNNGRNRVEIYKPSTDKKS